MKKTDSKNVAKISMLDNPVNIKLDFSEFAALETKSQEIRGCLLTGKHGVQHAIRPANIVLCKVNELESQDGLFEYVDFKDSFIHFSEFNNCLFNFGAIINCDFESVRFEGGEFRNVSITNSKFKSCIFFRCNLDHMVIESCRFVNCTFIECSTSNKLFDYCLLIDCKFENMELQVQTIISSFGITTESLANCTIRDKSKNEQYNILSLTQIEAFQSISYLEQFKLEYFVNPGCLLSGADSFDRTFEIENWVGTAKIPLTFTNLISMYSEFLFDRYDNNKLYIFAFIRLHALTNSLIESGALDQAAMTVVQGVHMSLSGLVEDYITELHKLSNSAEKPFLVLVNGPLNKQYYYDELAFVFQNNNLSIDYIKKHNSPNELALAWANMADLAPFIAIFLATRFRLEFSKRKEAIADENIKSPKVANKIAEQENKFLLHLGFDDENTHLYGIKLRSIFPGNLVGELGLQISTKQIHSARTLLVKVFSTTEKT